MGIPALACSRAKCGWSGPVTPKHAEDAAKLAAYSRRAVVVYWKPAWDG